MRHRPGRAAPARPLRGSRRSGTGASPSARRTGDSRGRAGRPCRARCRRRTRAAIPPGNGRTSGVPRSSWRTGRAATTSAPGLSRGRAGSRASPGRRRSRAGRRSTDTTRSGSRRTPRSGTPDCVASRCRARSRRRRLRSADRACPRGARRSSSRVVGRGRTRGPPAACTTRATFPARRVSRRATAAADARVVRSAGRWRCAWERGRTVAARESTCSTDACPPNGARRRRWCRAAPPDAAAEVRARTARIGRPERRRHRLGSTRAAGGRPTRRSPGCTQTGCARRRHADWCAACRRSRRARASASHCRAATATSPGSAGCTRCAGSRGSASPCS